MSHLVRNREPESRRVRMRLGTYNVENLFMRARALNLATWAEGKGVLERFAALNSVLNKARYTRSDKTRIVRLLEELGLGAADDGGSFVVLRQTRRKPLATSS